MKVIYKYPLEIKGKTKIELARGGKPLAVQMQNGQLMLWAEIDNKAVCTLRTVTIVGTGQPIYDYGDYIGTVQTHGGQYIWHVYIK